MLISYAKDYRHNYLVIQDDRVLRDDYQLKMIAENDIKGLLKCQERMVNGEGLLYYDITSRQSLKALYADKKMQMDEIGALFIQIKELCERMQRFLLYGDGVCFMPEYIFMDVGSREYSFLYYPYASEDMSIMPLLEFLMERLDNEDMDAVEAVYQIADAIGRGHYGMDEALTWFVNEYAVKDDVNSNEDEVLDSTSENMTNMSENDYEDWERSLYEDEKEKAKKESLWEKIIRFFTGKDKAGSREEDKYEEELFYPDEADMYEDNKDTSTVFIPWIESSEHKLYGLDRKNKKHIDLTKAPFTIGKLQGAADVILQDESVSRVHAKIVRQSGKYYMVDMNSTNGCFRNGMRLSPNEKAQIEPGDEIGFGKLKFIYR